MGSVVVAWIAIGTAILWLLQLIVGWLVPHGTGRRLGASKATARRTEPGASTTDVGGRLR